jgi:hypothetical protein
VKLLKIIVSNRVNDRDGVDFMGELGAETGVKRDPDAESLADPKAPCHDKCRIG